MSARLGIIGAGKIGEALLQGVFAKGLMQPSDVILSVRTEKHRADLEARLGVRSVLDNCLVAEEAEIIVLAVKPKSIVEVLAQIAPQLKPGKFLISTAAGVVLNLIESKIPGDIGVIRSMPNLAVSVGEGMTVLSPGRNATPAQVASASGIFEAVGRVAVLDEEHMDAVTGLSGSGPAYVYIIIEALADGGVKLGLPREVATELAAQTVLGAAKTVLSTGEHPAKLKDQVTTPAGVTIDGILELEEGGLRVTLIKAVVKAAERSRQLLHK
ncbi:MAG: pyrroline-5-carboxylate reductase [Rectinema sp.]